MSDYIRRLVSGQKSRHKDAELDLELDLAYITDQIIVMGYPASGIEGFYRNRREDTKRFLEHHHGSNYCVFNFCPIRENSYPASVFDGRVRRYPFPDHHAPPFAILALAAREIHLWLDGYPERVAVLHCKAGKGRSGTMACAYLLTALDAAAPSAAPSLERSRTEKERAKSRAEQFMNAMPIDEAAAEVIPATTPQAEGEDPVKLELADADGDSGGNTTDEASKLIEGSEGQKPDDGTMSTLCRVLELHTARRMKRPSSASALKPGVSIPSQRRWLYYWSLVLAQQAPPAFWPADSADVLARQCPKVRLTQIEMRMRELGGFKANLVRAANALLERAGRIQKIDTWARNSNSSQVWASLARYDDDLVDTLERWERHTRDESGNMGVRREHSGEMGGEAIGDLFEDDRWDGEKMVRSFARMSTVGDEDVRKEASNEGGKTETLVLRPLTGDSWQSIRTKIEEDRGQASRSRSTGSQAGSADPSPTTGLETEDVSMDDVTQALKADSGVVLDAHREIRVKLYLGQVFMGWFWFIPTFHMHRSRADAGTQQQPTTFTLTRKELDFPVGVGSNILDVTVSMEWCEEAADVVSPPECVTGDNDPQGIAAALSPVTAGEAEGIGHAK